MKFISIIYKIVIPHGPHYIGKHNNLYYDNISHGDGGYEEVIFAVIIIVIACIVCCLDGFKK